MAQLKQYTLRVCVYCLLCCDCRGFDCEVCCGWCIEGQTQPQDAKTKILMLIYTSAPPSTTQQPGCSLQLAISLSAYRLSKISKQHWPLAGSGFGMSLGYIYLPTSKY
jgi:hypothetical protein